MLETATFTSTERLSDSGLLFSYQWIRNCSTSLKKATHLSTGTGSAIHNGEVGWTCAFYGSLTVFWNSGTAAVFSWKFRTAEILYEIHFSLIIAPSYAREMALKLLF